MSETLNRKTVAIFSTEANKKIIAELKGRGELIELPPVSVVKSEYFKIDIYPFDFDWLIFTDVFAADFFLEKLTEQDFDLYELDAVRVCAFGEAVSDRLRFAQVHADVIPPKINTSMIFASLKDYISSESNFDGLRFLIVKEESAEIEVAGILRELKAVVTEIALYRFEITRGENLTRLKTLLKGGAADEFVFTSPSDAAALRFLFGEDLSDLLRETQISATDEVTFQTLLENGLRPLYFRK